jgi:tetratricopeptide (TPR) repeat protein
MPYSMKKAQFLVLFVAIPCFINRVSGQDSGTKRSSNDTTSNYVAARKRVDSLTQAIQHQTGNRSLAGSYFLRGTDEETLTQPDSALNDYTEAISLNPELKQAYVARAAIYERKNQLKEALNDDEMAIKLYQDDKSELVYLYGRIGLTQWALKQYPEALAADSIVDQLKPGDSFARVNMGWVHFSMKEYALAVSDFTAGMPGYKDDLSKLHIIVTGRANAERNLKLYNDAIKDYLYSLTLSPGDKPSRWNLALSYKLIGDYEKSETEYDKTIQLFAGDKRDLAKLYDEKAMLDIEERKYKVALQDDSTAISYNRTFGRSYTTMATAYMQNADFQPAIDTYLHALNFYSNDKSESSSIYDGIANAYYFLGKFDKAVKACDSAIEMDGGSFITFFNRGRCYYKMKDNDRASADFNKVLAMDTGKNSYEYAFALFYVGKPDEAIKSIQKSITDSTNKYLVQSHFYNVACLYALMNKPIEANSYLKKCVDSGYSKKYALTDPDLDNIKETTEFKDLMK